MNETQPRPRRDLPLCCRNLEAYRLKPAMARNIDGGSTLLSILKLHSSNTCPYVCHALRGITRRSLLSILPLFPTEAGEASAIFLRLKGMS